MTCVVIAKHSSESRVSLCGLYSLVLTDLARTWVPLYLWLVGKRIPGVIFWELHYIQTGVHKMYCKCTRYLLMYPPYRLVGHLMWKYDLQRWSWKYLQKFFNANKRTKFLHNVWLTFLKYYQQSSSYIMYHQYKWSLAIEMLFTVYNWIK